MKEQFLFWCYLYCQTRVSRLFFNEVSSVFSIESIVLLQSQVFDIFCCTIHLFLFPSFLWSLFTHFKLEHLSNWFSIAWLSSCGYQRKFFRTVKCSVPTFWLRSAIESISKFRTIYHFNHTTLNSSQSHFIHHSQFPSFRAARKKLERSSRTKHL